METKLVQPKKRRGDTIKKLGVFFALAMAMAVSAVAMEQNLAAGTCGGDILGKGKFETGDSAFKFDPGVDTNFDSIKMGNDYANAVGIGVGIFPFADEVGATAKNNVKIMKNQNSGECVFCQAADSSSPCKDCSIKYNIEKIDLGNRKANAVSIGGGLGPFASDTGAKAENNIIIATNQE